MNMRRRSWRVFVSAGIPSMFCLVLRIANPDWMLIVQDDGWMLLNLLFAIPSFILMSPLMLLPFSGVTIHDYPFWMPETLEDRQPEACPRGCCCATVLTGTGRISLLRIASSNPFTSVRSVLFRCT